MSVGYGLSRAGMIGIVADVHAIADGRPPKDGKVAAGGHAWLVWMRFRVSV